MTADLTASEPPTARAAAAPGPRLGLVLAVCCLAQFMVTLDVSIVNVALPSIQGGLHFSAGGLQWVVNAYAIVFAGLLLLGGRAADLFGRRRTFLLGITVFTLASLAGGLATTAGLLIAARAVQGVGAAILAPTTLTVLGTSYSDPVQRARAFGVWGAVAGAGGACGALAGGVLTDLLSWRWILFVNVPIGIALVVGARYCVSELRHGDAGRRLDLPGSVLVTGGVSALVYGIVESGPEGWGAGRTLIALGLGAVLLAAFVVHQARFAADPVVPLDVFRARGLSGASLIAFTSGAALFAMFYFVTLYLQQVLGYNPLRTGLAYLPLASAIVVAARFAPWVVRRIGARWTLGVGMASVVAGLGWLSRITQHSGFAADILGPTVIIGLGQGLVMATGTIVGIAAAPAHRTGLASGILNAARQLGGAIGLAALATVATDRTTHLLGSPVGRGAAGAHVDGHAGAAGAAHAYAAGYGLAFAVAAGVSLLGLAAVALLPAASAGRPRT